MSETITLRRRAQGWTADYAQTPDAQLYAHLFGTTEIPLPLTLDASADHALEHMRGLPDVHKRHATIEIEQ
jgi:hypothetical protein